MKLPTRAPFAQVVMVLAAVMVVVEAGAVFSHADTPARIGPAPVPIVHSLEQRLLDSLRTLTGHAHNRATVLAFLSPECPLSRNHVLTLNRLTAHFAADSVAMVGFVPRIIPGSPELDSFRIQTGMRFFLSGDSNLVWARALGASVTPEVFLIDAEGTVLYSGALDDRALSLGERRPAATVHYLRDALDAWKSGRPASRNRVTPVGCRIE
jgi:hypothetical protein